jgi:integrase/recombinase XerD
VGLALSRVPTLSCGGDTWPESHFPRALRPRRARGPAESLAWPAYSELRAHVERWLRRLEEQGRSPATRAQYLSALSGYYAEAIDLKVIARNSVARIRRRKTGQDSPRLGLDVEEVRRLLHAAVLAGPRDAALASLLLHCGLRISEALGLMVGDLSTSRGHRTEIGRAHV